MAQGKSVKQKAEPLKKVKTEIKMEPIINKSQDLVCGCGHGRVMHYGGDRGHCNTNGCSCVVYQ